MVAMVRPATADTFTRVGLEEVSGSGVTRSRGPAPGHGAAPRHHHVHHAAGDAPGHGQRQAHAVQRVVGVLYGERSGGHYEVIVRSL